MPEIPRNAPGHYYPPRWRRVPMHNISAVELWILTDASAGGGDYDALNLVTPDPSREYFDTLLEAKTAKAALIALGEVTDVDIYRLTLEVAV